MRVFGWICLVAIAGVVMLMVVGSQIDGGPGLGGVVYPSENEARNIEARLAAIGFHCPTARSMQRTQVKSNGDKVYRLECGGDGPYYAITVHPDGTQSTMPIGE